MDLKTSASNDTAGSRTLPPRDDIADEDFNVFIPLDTTAEEIRKIVFDKEQITFVRAPVAAGKTTLANFLVKKFPESFVLVETAGSVESWRENLREAYPGADTARAAVKAIQKEKKALVIDEAHLLFGCMEVFSDLTKLWKPKVKILMFSAAATGQSNNGIQIVAPEGIHKKYMWYPPIPRGNDLVSQLEEAGIFLDGDSVDFLMKICGGHRGIFMMAALHWVKDRQQQEAGHTANSPKTWDIKKCVTEVRDSFESSERLRRRNIGSGWGIGLKDKMTECRAVMVNGNFSDLNNIPHVFTDIVFGGPRENKHLNGKERELTIAGFLVPERQRDTADNEFVPYNWNKEETRYGVANALMGEYYYDVFSSRGEKREMTQYMPNSGIDLLARALPFMTFSNVVDNVITHDGERKSSLSPQELPYEVHYNKALAKVFTELGYTVACPENKDGKVDVIVGFEDNTQTKKRVA